MSDIEEHLEKHDAVLRGVAHKIAREAGQPDLADDCYNAGVLVLCVIHRGDKYDHAKSELLTFAWWPVRGAMKAIVSPYYQEYAFPPEGEDRWEKPIGERQRGVQDFMPVVGLENPYDPNSLVIQQTEDPNAERNEILAWRKAMEAKRKATGVRPEHSCEVCWLPLPPRSSKRGRPRRYCSERCKKAAQRITGHNA